MLEDFHTRSGAIARLMREPLGRQLRPYLFRSPLRIVLGVAAAPPARRRNRSQAAPSSETGAQWLRFGRGIGVARLRSFFRVTA